jgi:hypothetical protein
MWPIVVIGAVALAALVYSGGSILHWHANFTSDEFNSIAAWASIYGLALSCVGLFLSGYAAWGIRQIKTRFLIKARLPALAKSLQKNAATLSDMAEEQPPPQQDKTTLFSSIMANLNAVRRHAPSQIKKSQKDTMRAFDQLAKQANEAPAAAMSALPAFWDAYEKIQLLKNEIDHYLAD